MSEGIILRRRPSPILLDRFRGAAAGYSLRELSSQTTNVVKVRRDSDNAEQDFTAGEIDDGSLSSWVGNTASDNGFVTTWYDQSGNGNDATQSTANDQPKIVDAGSLVTENGKAAINIDTNFSNALILNSKTLINSFIGVVNIISDLAFFNGGGYIFIGPNAIRWRTPDTETNLFEGSIQNELQLGSAYNDFGNCFAYINNIPAINNPVTNRKTFGFSAIGNPGQTRNREFNICELVVYPDDQSTNRQQIESNINNHYGIY